MVPYQCIPEDHPLADRARECFPHEWVERFHRMLLAEQAKQSNPLLIAKREQQAQRKAAEEQARQAALEEAEARRAEFAARRVLELQAREEAAAQAEALRAQQELDARREAEAAELARIETEAAEMERLHASMLARSKAPQLRGSASRGSSQSQGPLTTSSIAGRSPSSASRRTKTPRKPGLPEAARGKQSLTAVKKDIYNNYPASKGRSTVLLKNSRV